MKKSVKNIGCYKHSFLLITVLLFIVSCGAGKTLVIKPPQMKLKTSFVDFSEEAPTINVPEKIRKTFEEKLNHLLYGDGTFQKGSDLKIKYRFIIYDPGNQFSRWFWGGIGDAGEGSLTLEAMYFDATGKELSTIEVEGRIKSGAFGGSFDYALERAAKEIVEYTKQNFQ